MDDKILTVSRNRRCTEDVRELTLSGDVGTPFSPGQFLDLKLPGFFLRRPFSILDQNKNSVTILFRVAGAGTKALAEAVPGDMFSCLLPLGNGFDLPPLLAADHPVLVGGGIGMPPVFALAKAMTALGKRPSIVLGYRSREDVLSPGRFRALGIEPVITTEDGSRGRKGLVTDVLPELCPDYVCACGPTPMLNALLPLMPDGQLSFEARMGCGFGACMGCSMETADGRKRVCKDGPVFRKGEILSEENAAADSSAARSEGAPDRDTPADAEEQDAAAGAAKEENA